MNLRPNLELDSMHGTTDLRPKPGGTNSDECMTLQLSQDLHGGLATKDELAAQSWARLSARDDQLAAQAWGHQL